MKLSNLEQRSLWFKKIYYYLKAGQSICDAARDASIDFETQYIYQELLNGMKLSDIFKDNILNKCFSLTEISLIAVAEKNGSIEKVSQSISQMLKSQYVQKQKLISATIYPGLVLLMAFGLLIMILTIIVPKISPLFLGMKDLPIVTRVLIKLSEHMTRIWYIDIIITIFIYLIYLNIKRKYTYQIYITRIQNFIFQKVIYIRDMYILWHIEKWMQVMCVSLSSGATLTHSLLYASESIKNKEFHQYFLELQKTVIQGNSCSLAMNQLPKPIYEKIKNWISVISSGEKTGSLKEVFDISHTHIRESLIESIERFQKVIEPTLIIIVGIMVLSICLSIILPMYQLTQSLQ